ncbi:MAG: hypothetical protein PHI85_00305 [Victivallaceae bacterium]|nr:hypothetical protein [Victivallaceae bacterium]
MSLVMIGSMLFCEDYKFIFFPRGAWAYILYFFIGIVSGINAVNMNAWGNEVLKMVWMYLFFISCYNFINMHRDLHGIIYTVAVILIFMFVFALYQKYLLGIYQVASTFPHQNSMGMYVIVFTSIMIGVIFNERVPLLGYILVCFGFVCGCLLLVFALSRGGLMCFGTAVLIVIIMSIGYNGWNRKRIVIMTIMMIGTCALAVKAAPRIYERFVSAPENSKITRINLALAAKRIANDYTFGVGMNNFSSHSGPYSPYAVEQYAEMSETAKSEFGAGPIVETTYLLVAAECGWIGLGILLLWFLVYWRMMFLNVIYLQFRPCFGISVGIFAGWTSNMLQSSLEWSLKQYGNFYEQMFIFALTAVLFDGCIARRRGERHEHEARMRQRIESTKPWKRRADGDLRQRNPNL